MITCGEERIEIVVAELQRHKVRLAFEADKSVRIDRSEVDDRRKECAA